MFSKKVSCMIGSMPIMLSRDRNDKLIVPSAECQNTHVHCGLRGCVQPRVSCRLRETLKTTETEIGHPIHRSDSVRCFGLVPFGYSVRFVFPVRFGVRFISCRLVTFSASLIVLLCCVFGIVCEQTQLM